MKKILVVVLLTCVFSIGLLSCGNDEPNSVNDRKYLYGTWESDGYVTVYNGREYLDPIYFGDEYALPIVVITPSSIYNFLDGEIGMYDTAITDWYIFDGFIYGTQMVYNGNKWDFSDASNPTYKIEIVSKHEIILHVPVMDIGITENTKKGYALFPFKKISKRYDY